MSEPETVYRCDCDDCDRVVATRDEDEAIVIKTRHDGDVHETRIPLGQPDNSEPLQPALRRWAG